MAGLIKRGGIYYVTINRGGKQVRRSLRTDSYQLAKERKRQIEQRLAHGSDNPLPTRTPIGEVVAAYIDHMRAHRPERSWTRDLSYLREAFGQCCRELELSSSRARKCRDRRLPDDRRRTLKPIMAACFEEITTAAISDFIAEQVRAKGLAPKTANRYREVIAKLINWAITTGRVRMPNDHNPASRVARYREQAPQIRFLTLPQIDEQLHALRFRPQLQTMVAVLIYAGLRREELLWLQTSDLQRPSPTAPNGLLCVRAKAIAGKPWQPKTARNRAVPISGDLRRYLDRYTPPASDHGWLFPSPHGTRWQPDNFSQALRKANREAGLVWGSLDYRHTFGSQLAQAGVSLLQIATLMGNSPEICRRHYASITVEPLVTSVHFRPTIHTVSEQ